MGKKKKGKGKKAAKTKKTPRPNYVDDNADSELQFVDKTAKVKKFTGFESDEETKKKIKLAKSMEYVSSSEDENVTTQTTGKMSAAQRKKVKKMQQKQKQKEEEEKRAREKAAQAKEAERLAKIKKIGKRKTRDIRVEDSEGSFYEEESYYEDSEGVKRKRKKHDVRHEDSEGSYYEEESFYETEEESKKLVQKRVRKKREVRKVDSEGSYYTEESYSESEEPEKPERKKIRKVREARKVDSDGSYYEEESYYSFESEEEEKKPAAKKKKDEAKPKKKQHRKKPEVNKKDPTKTVKKARPTMSDDSDSQDSIPVRRSPSPKKNKPQAFGFGSFLLDDSEEEEYYEEEIEEEAEEEPEKEATPDPEEIKPKKKPSWKNKKKNKKKQQEDDGFDELAWLDDNQPKKKAVAVVQEEGGKAPTEEVKSELSLEMLEEKDPKDLTKAQKKRMKRLRQKRRKEQGDDKAEATSPKPAKNLSKQQQARLEKLEKQAAERKKNLEEKKRLDEEARIKDEEEEKERERIAEERGRIKDKKNKEKNERRRKNKQTKKYTNTNEAAIAAAKAKNEGHVERRKRIAEEKKKKKEEAKRQKAEAAAKAKAEKERKERELEEERKRKEEEEEREKQRLKEEDERKKRETAEREAELSRKISEQVMKKATGNKKKDEPEEQNDWDGDSEDDWEAEDDDEDKNEWDGVESEYEEEEEEEVVNEWSDSSEPEPEPVPEPVPEPEPEETNEWSDEESEEKLVAVPKKTKEVAQEKAAAEPKAEKKKKKKSWTCAKCLQENKIKVKKCTSCGTGKPKKPVDLSNLRAPIGVIMGNVDSGKTSLLDYIRRTKVQDGEAGGITQQIGTTNLPMEKIKELCGEGLVAQFIDEVALPGLLIIDTPGHQAFGNMRERGSTMCDIAIVVINLFDGIIGTAHACIKMLTDNDAPFIVAFNQVDKIYGWEVKPGMSIEDSLKSQTKFVRDVFDKNLRKTQLDFANLGLNADLFWDNTDLQKGKVKRENLNLVPTSAKSGCGVPDLLLLWVKLCQTKKLSKRLKITPMLNCTILEVKKVIGLGYVLDVLISDGCLCVGQTIAVCSIHDRDGIVTVIRDLQTPCEIQDSRVEKARYNSNTTCTASMGCRIVCKENVEHAVAGSKILLINDPRDEEEVLEAREEVQIGLKALQNMERSDVGVFVVASTLGSLEALTKFLQEEVHVPMAGFSLGTVHKKHVMRASVMKENHPEYAVILAFDVQISKEAAIYADEEDITIFSEEIIYQLQERFVEHLELEKERKRESVKADVVFPCVLRILEDKIFNRKNPIVMGVRVEKGDLRMGTPLVAVTDSGKQVYIGRVEGIREVENEIETADKGKEVAIKVALTADMTTTAEYNRHFNHTNLLVSKISRRSIEAVRTHYRKDITKDQAKLLKMLKEKIFFKEWQ